jgi:hypothetical protein
LTAVGLYTLAVNKQIGILERASRNEIRMMREFNELQIRETDKKIDAMRELVAIQVNSIEKTTKESIKASEARIDSILLKFVVENKHIANEK